MPIYEFQCPQCGTKIEKLQKMSDLDADCPKCESTMIKLISAANHVLNGTGWYKTDFRGK